MSKIFHSNIQALQETESVLDPVVLAKAVALIRQADRRVGVGRPIDRQS
ncbi:hypothetical protein [Alcaligenes faecalis]|nr:hypothetical protein [Alcaligenes faecalis]